MYYKTIVKKRYQEKLTQVFQWPYPFITRANLKNLGTVSFLKVQGIRRDLHILKFLFKTYVLFAHG